jgi:hypothetical protein
MPKAAAGIDAYIAAFDPVIGKRLTAVRVLIRKAAPQATESINYRMPACKRHGPLIYFFALENLQMKKRFKEEQIIAIDSSRLASLPGKPSGLPFNESL